MSRKIYKLVKDERDALRKKWIKLQIQRNQAILGLRLARDQIRSYEERLTGVTGVTPILIKIEEILDQHGEESQEPYGEE